MNTEAAQLSNASSDKATIDLIEKFQADCALQGIVSARDYTRNARELALFLHIRGKGVLDISRDDLKAFLSSLRERKLKQRSINRTFVCLSGFYTFLVDEDYIASNPILPFRRRYLRNADTKNDSEMRQIISVSDASKLANSILDSRDKALVVLLFKTGARRKEISALDVTDINLEKGEIEFKPAKKRSNKLLYLDDEAIRTLSKWLQVRKTRKGANSPALFLSRRGSRLGPERVRRIVEVHASRVGLHNPKSEKLEDHFGPHCCRHWFTTHLIRAGMPRDFVKELRGDSRHEAIDIYNHIDKKELRESYLAHIPQLGI